MITETYKPTSREWSAALYGGYQTTHHGRTTYPVSNYQSPPQQQQVRINNVTPVTHPGRVHTDYRAFAAVRAAAMGISTEEWMRRDQIVGDEYNSCHFSVGDTFYPYTYAEFLLRGKCLITGKVSVYSQMEKDAWPESNCPMIITARSLQGVSTFFCTVGYMIKQEG